MVHGHDPRPPYAWRAAPPFPFGSLITTSREPAVLGTSRQRAGDGARSGGPDRALLPDAVHRCRTHAGVSRTDRAWAEADIRRDERRRWIQRRLSGSTDETPRAGVRHAPIAGRPADTWSVSSRAAVTLSEVRSEAGWPIRPAGRRPRDPAQLLPPGIQSSSAYRRRTASSLNAHSGTTQTAADWPACTRCRSNRSTSHRRLRRDTTRSAGL